MSGARLQTKASGVRAVNTSLMRPIQVRIAGLTGKLGLFYDDLSAGLGTADDKAALKKADEITVPKNYFRVPNSYDFGSPTNVVLSDHDPERRFIDRLMDPGTAKEVDAWVKAPDTGFYEIEYTFQEGGTGRSKRGKFNPDFFICLKGGKKVVVCEVKADGDDSWRNKGKMSAARAHFDEVNRLLKEAGETRRYVVRIVSPKDYDKFFEALRAGKPETFESSLQAALDVRS